jgi:hypothetical protein
MITKEKYYSLKERPKTEIIFSFIKEKIIKDEFAKEINSYLC